MQINYLSLVVLSLMSFNIAKSLPQFSLISGNRCNSCHINQQGGGGRNDLGWYSYRDVSAIEPAEGIMSDFWAIQDSIRSMIGAKSNVGFDIRFQYIRSRNPSADASFFPMQFSVYGQHSFTSWLGVDAAYNIGPIRYKGQSSWSGSLRFQPGLELPLLRIGMLQPTIGIRNDDHTTLNRQIPADWLTDEVLTPYSQMTLIAPNFAAPGIEIGYEGLHWFSVHAGVFSNSSLNENAVTNDSDANLAYSTRIMFWPRFFENTVNTYIGASLLKNGDVSIIQYMLGIGLTDQLSFSVEATQSDIYHIRSISTDNLQNLPGSSTTYTTELMYQVESWLFPYVRAEYGELRNDQNKDHTIIKQFVIGAQIFLLPNIEFRPEYRMFDTYRPGIIGRWGAQFHLYY
jgi:hypothetical protein